MTRQQFIWIIGIFALGIPLSCVLYVLGLLKTDICSCTLLISKENILSFIVGLVVFPLMYGFVFYNAFFSNIAAKKTKRYLSIVGEGIPLFCTLLLIGLFRNGTCDGILFLTFKNLAILAIALTVGLTSGFFLAKWMWKKYNKEDKNQEIEE